MEIKEYLFRNDMSIKRLADIIECHPAYLGAVKRKEKKPGKKLARQIERATNGDVKAKELLISTAR